MRKYNTADSAFAYDNRADDCGKSLDEQIRELASNQASVKKFVDSIEKYLAIDEKDTDTVCFNQELPIIEAFVRQEVFKNGKYYRINTRSAVALAKFFFIVGIKWNTGEKSLKNILKWK